jgi:hypothetical protein
MGLNEENGNQILFFGLWFPLFNRLELVIHNETWLANLCVLLMTIYKTTCIVPSFKHQKHQVRLFS